jgi:ABC-type lipoprotein release transport system permease subunit
MYTVFVAGMAAPLFLFLAGLTIAMAVGSTVLASLYPALKASRLPVVDALRHNV